MYQCFFQVLLVGFKLLFIGIFCGENTNILQSSTCHQSVDLANRLMTQGLLARE